MQKRPDGLKRLSGQNFPVCLRCPCKVNLYLEIGEKRPDGFHDLVSLFYPLSRPFDRLFLFPQDENCSVSCSREELGGSGNILARTYDKFFQATGFTYGVHIYLEKNVPVGAGLGGGSANAAVFLRWLNSVAGKKALSGFELHELAAELGADVPFFLQEKAALVEGKGEKITPCETVLDGWGLLISPNIQVGTAAAYAELDEMRKKQGFCLTSSLHKQYRDKLISGTWLYNSFEPLILGKYPQLQQIKEKLLGFGCNGCVLSGTGASLFARFSKRQNLQKAVTHFQQFGYSFTIVRLNTGVSPSW